MRAGGGVSFVPMEYLVTTPPVITPSEPPSGAFLLAAGLRARGVEAGFLDLSLEFFRFVFARAPAGRGHPDAGAALALLTENESYSPQEHRTASGMLNSVLKHYSRRFPGWRVTLMDVLPPEPVHAPGRIRRICEKGETPFTEFWNEFLLPRLEQYRPKTILVSLSYLSQLPAGIDLSILLKDLGYRVIFGGSLLNSLSRTGEGFGLASEVLAEIAPGDGSSFPGFAAEEPLLANLRWPEMPEGWNYISGRPVIPFALSTGCYWNRCLFCPDAGRELKVFGGESLMGFLESIPDEIMQARPVIHFLDSAAPRKPLKDALPILKDRNMGFYTFARPEPWVADMADELREHGCMMLQLGVESGSRRLLDLYQKGITPEISLEAIVKCAGAGIRTYVYMLLGLPGETEEDVLASMELLRKAGTSVDFINFSIFNLPEYCELRERASRFGIQLLEPDATEDCIRLYRPFLHEGVNPRLSARISISSRFPNILSVQDALRRTPRWFRTSHFPLIDIPGRN